MNRRLDNPMTALISFPQVLGHEVVGVVESVGPEVTQRRVGERVVLNPWLSCAPRGLPPCEWCQRGEYAQCRNFTRGAIAPGIHHGNSRDATGGFAPLVPAHESQCIPIPEGVRDEEAVLADPFSVSLHAVLHEPPRSAGSEAGASGSETGASGSEAGAAGSEATGTDGGVALVYGCGTLGLLAIAILRALHPEVRVLAVARYDHQARLAEKLGAERVIRHEPARRVIEEVAEAVGVEVEEPWRGLPMLNGGVDIVYDTVSAPSTLEIGVRVARPRGKIIALGVEPPKRFEWTPLYFKELALIGSNAFAIEEWDGRRQHAMEWYFELLRTTGLDASSIITHRYPLESYRDAFLACWNQGASSAVKVLFEFPDGS
jgi:threonine dehydrogenase-like Zn-dependent dehydrogenase